MVLTQRENIEQGFTIYPLVSQQNVTTVHPSSLVDEDGAGHGGYPGGPVDLDVRILVRLRQDVAVLGVGEVKCSILSVVSCVVSQDYILLRKRALKRLQSTKVLTVQVKSFRLFASN